MLPSELLSSLVLPLTALRVTVLQKPTQWALFLKQHVLSPTQESHTRENQRGVAEDGDLLNIAWGLAVSPAWDMSLKEVFLTKL